jgi:hypothetical protein
LERVLRAIKSTSHSSLRLRSGRLSSSLAASVAASEALTASSRAASSASCVPACLAEHHPSIEQQQRRRPLTTSRAPQHPSLEQQHHSFGGLAGLESRPRAARGCVPACRLPSTTPQLSSSSVRDLDNLPCTAPPLARAAAASLLRRPCRPRVAPASTSALLAAPRASEAKLAQLK